MNGHTHAQTKTRILLGINQPSVALGVGHMVWLAITGFLFLIMKNEVSTKACLQWLIYCPMQYLHFNNSEKIPLCVFCFQFQVPHVLLHPSLIRTFSSRFHTFFFLSEWSLVIVQPGNHTVHVTCARYSSFQSLMDAFQHQPKQHSFIVLWWRGSWGWIGTTLLL